MIASEWYSHSIRAATERESTNMKTQKEDKTVIETQETVLYSVEKESKNSKKAPWYEFYQEVLLFAEYRKASLFKNKN